MKTKRIKYRKNELILHIPHSSRYIPDNCRDIFYIDDKKLDEELKKMTDSYTNELFDISGVPAENKIVFPYSRLICDVERFRDDEKESMAMIGMAMCYTKTSDLMKLKVVSDKHRIEMLKLYDIHHNVLERAVDNCLIKNNCALILDCHSFSSAPLPYEMISTNKRNRVGPDICIGTDKEHTPKWLKRDIVKNFKASGYTVEINYPYAGTLVPMKHYMKDNRVNSVMIEVNRSLYMDEKNCSKRPEFEKVKKDINDVIYSVTEKIS